jgi:hypothetical protein
MVIYGPWKPFKFVKPEPRKRFETFRDVKVFGADKKSWVNEAEFF